MTSLAGTLIEGAGVADTVDDPGWVPVEIVARLAEPVVTVADPMMFDGVLSWAMFQMSQESGTVLPPLSDAPPVDFWMPLATWTAIPPGGAHPSLLNSAGLVWGWACSRASYTPAGWTTAHTRKAPPMGQYARYSRDRRYHAALGPQKARNAAHQALMVSSITWWALADPGPLREALTRLDGVGRLTRHGWGRIDTLTVTTHSDRGAWKDRPWPDPAGTMAGSARAPHWHHTRRVTCSSTHPDYRKTTGPSGVSDHDPMRLLEPPSA